jgi:hypothetical protein
MEKVCSSETYESTRRHNPEHLHRSDTASELTLGITVVCSTETIYMTGKANLTTRHGLSTASQFSWELHCGEKWGSSIEQGETNTCHGTNTSSTEEFQDEWNKFPPNF